MVYTKSQKNNNCGIWNIDSFFENLKKCLTIVVNFQR